MIANTPQTVTLPDRLSADGREPLPAAMATAPCGNREPSSERQSFSLEGETTNGQCTTNDSRPVPPYQTYLRPLGADLNMTSAPPEPDGCQAGQCYTGLICFRGRVETSGSSPVSRESVACAKHLGSMVLSLTACVHEQQLQGAKLTVLAIDPAAHPAVATDGFAFISFRVIP